MAPEAKAADGASAAGPAPAKDQLPGVDFCLTSNPPWHDAVILGFQHFLVMIGTTVMIPTALVPQMGGGPKEKAEVIQTLLFVSGLSTLCQTQFGCRTTVVVRGSYSFVIPAIAIIFSNKHSTIADPHLRFKKSMQGIQGAIMFSSMLPVGFGILGLWRIVMRFVSPLAAVPLLTLTGLGLYQLGFPQVAKCIEIGLPTLIILVLISQYLGSFVKPCQAIGRRYAVILTVAISGTFAAILTAAGAFKHTSQTTQDYCRTDRSGLLHAAPWIYLPYPFRWGRPTMSIGGGFAMIAASFVSLVESTGTFISAARFASATPMPPSVVGRGVFWLGVSNFFFGAWGALCGPTVSVENAGLLGLHQIGSRRIAQISAGFMLVFSFLGKFGAVLASIPMSIFAAVYCVLFAYVASSGLGLLQFCNLNSFRTKFILGFSIYMGLSVSQYFNEYLLITGHSPVNSPSEAFNSIFQVIFSSPATVAGIVALFLDSTLLRSHNATLKDSGRHWWKKFKSFDADPRSDEFYSLPWGLDKYFPSV